METVTKQQQQQSLLDASTQRTLQFETPAKTPNKALLDNRQQRTESMRLISESLQKTMISLCKFDQPGQKTDTTAVDESFRKTVSSPALTDRQTDRQDQTDNKPPQSGSAEPTQLLKTASSPAHWSPRHNRDVSEREITVQATPQRSVMIESEPEKQAPPTPPAPQPKKELIVEDDDWESEVEEEPVVVDENLQGVHFNMPSKSAVSEVCSMYVCCLHVYVCVYMCVCVCVYIYIYIYIY